MDHDYRLITLSDGSEISAHAVILALGVSWRRLEYPRPRAVYRGGGLLRRGPD